MVGPATVTLFGIGEILGVRVWRVLKVNGLIMDTGARIYITECNG